MKLMLPALLFRLSISGLVFVAWHHIVSSPAEERQRKLIQMVRAEFATTTRDKAYPPLTVNEDNH